MNKKNRTFCFEIGLNPILATEMMLRIIFTLIFLCFALIIKADQGCYISNRIYFNQTGTVSFFGMGTRYLYHPNIFYEDYISNCTGASAMARRSNMASQGIFGSPIQCGFTGDSYYAAAKGYVWNFDVIVCPIDSHAFFILLLTACSGCYFIRKKFTYWLT